MDTEKLELSRDGLPTSTNPEGVSSHDKASSLVDDEKAYYTKTDVESSHESEDSDDHVLADERDIATHVITIEDDPSANPWTFRSFFIGIGLSAFGGVLAEIYYFKPQTVLVSTMFLAIISYVVCSNSPSGSVKPRLNLNDPLRSAYLWKQLYHGKGFFAT
jgi:hypothetical protein